MNWTDFFTGFICGSVFASLAIALVMFFAFKSDDEDIDRDLFDDGGER